MGATADLSHAAARKPRRADRANDIHKLVHVVQLRQYISDTKNRCTWKRIRNRGNTWLAEQLYFIK